MKIEFTKKEIDFIKKCLSNYLNSLVPLLEAKNKWAEKEWVRNKKINEKISNNIC